MERDNLMHGARTALNTDMDIRAWAENYLKEKTRGENTPMTDEEFEKHWRYHKPEIMHGRRRGDGCVPESEPGAVATGLFCSVLIARWRLVHAGSTGTTSAGFV